MKNIKFSLLVAFAAVGSFLLSSCGGTGDDIVTAPKPILNFLAGAGYTSADGEVVAGSDFKVGLSASHESKIETLTIAVSYDGGVKVAPLDCSVCDTTINSKTFQLDFENTVESTPGTETWYFTVADKDGNSTTQTITFTRTAVPKAIRKIDIDLGNQNSSSIGSSLSLEDLSVFLLSEAKDKSGDVDLLYVKDENTGTSIIGAASSTTIHTWLPSVANWATKNETKIRKTSYSTGKFSSMTDSKELLAEISSSAATSSHVEIAEGDVIYVGPVSPNGKHALLKITTISDLNNSVSVTVLVEDI